MTVHSRHINAYVAVRVGWNGVRWACRRISKKALLWRRPAPAPPCQRRKVYLRLRGGLQNIVILTKFTHRPPSTLFSVDPTDITWLVMATCIVPDMSFYHRLVAVTIGPLVVLAVLYATYRVAMYRRRRGTATKRRQQAKMRHASAALLVLFLASCFCSVTAEGVWAEVGERKIVLLSELTCWRPL